ncbi:MAG: protein kinase [Planctomycetes bacterium]|nr:protein kinase [Planctomycetota bacterium]
MSEPRPPDDTESKLGKTKLVSGPSAIPSEARLTASHGFAFDNTNQPLPQSIGRFEVRACLGSGAFGWVYRAFDPTLRREVAIKLPRPDRLQTPNDRARFLNEARAAATIRHPHVVPVHDVGELDGIPVIVMGYGPGPPLAAVLTERTEPFAPHEAARIVRSLALAVQAAHDKGVVHRDLKPANVLFDPEHAEYVVTDFGLARVVDPNDPRASSTGVAGTPSYMPPEQARGDSAAVGPRSDVYALGVILFELLTGRLPFTGGSVADVISQVLITPPPTASSLQANIPAALDAVCRKAMAKSPDGRYSSALELATTLTPLTTPDSLDLTAQTVEMKPPSKTAPQRTHWRITIPALLVMAIVAVVAIFLLNSGKQNATRTDVSPDTKTNPPVGPTPKSGATASADRRAAEWVLKCGGMLEVIDTKSGTKLNPKTVAELPAEFQVTRLMISDSKAVTDAAVIANLSGLKGLRAVEFHFASELTNSGLEHLSRIPDLKLLGLRYCSKITNAGVFALKNHPTLRDVYISGSAMTVEGVLALATIPNLEVFGFHGHPSTDSWFEAASHAPNLKQLYAGYSQDHLGGRVTATGLSYLAKLKHVYLLDLDSAALVPGAAKGLPELPALNQLFLRKVPLSDGELVDVVRKYPRLEALALHETSVTEKGMETVAELASLQRLYLDGTKVGDLGLKHLTACKKLSYVSVSNTNVTDEGIREFRKALPRCEVNTVAPKE